MSKFPSTILPQRTDDVKEAQKATLDLLDKINQVAAVADAAAATTTTADNVLILNGAGYTILDDDGIEIIFVITGAVSQTILLPKLARNQKRIISVYKEDAGVGEVIVDGELAETINGWPVLYVGLQYYGLTVFGGVAEWRFL